MIISFIFVSVVFGLGFLTGIYAAGWRWGGR